MVLSSKESKWIRCITNIPYYDWLIADTKQYDWLAQPHLFGVDNQSFCQSNP